MKIVKKKNLKLISLSTLIVFASLSSMSCNLGLVGKKIEHATDEIIKRVRDEKDVQTTTTRYELPLRLFGRDLAFLIGEKTIFSISEIVNETTDPTLSTEIRGILRTAITKLNSSPLALKYLTIYTNVTPEQISGSINIMGTISESDQILSTSGTFNLDATFGGGQTKTDSSVSIDKNNVAKVLTLDLHAQLATGSNVISLPLGYATNTSILYKRTEGGSFSLYIMGNGFSIGGSASVSDSPNYALRLLTEFSLMQLIGRIYTVPYWHCVKTRNEDEPLYQYMVEEWATIPLYPEEGKNYKDSKLGKYADVARLFYGYYIAKDVKYGKIYSYSNTGRVPGIAFLREERKVVVSQEVDENGNPITVQREVVVKKVNKENVEKFIKALMKFYNIQGDMYSFDTYYKLLNETPFCGYPYDDKLKDFLLTELADVKFVAHPNDVKDPEILYADFLEKKFKRRTKVRY